MDPQKTGVDSVTLFLQDINAVWLCLFWINLRCLTVTLFWLCHHNSILWHAFLLPPPMAPSLAGVLKCCSCCSCCCCCCCSCHTSICRRPMTALQHLCALLFVGECNHWCWHCVSSSLLVCTCSLVAAMHAHSQCFEGHPKVFIRVFRLGFRAHTP